MPNFARIILAVAIATGLLASCKKPPEYPPVAESSPETQKAFMVLKGYLKRRNMVVDKNTVGVKVTEEKLIFRCQLDETEKYFSMQANKGSWRIKEIPAAETAP